MTKQPDIRSLDRDALRDWFLSQGEKRFRADQVYDWVWKKGAAHFEEMSNLSKGLRDKLSGHFALAKVSIEDVQISKDGTRKYAFRLAGGQQVEGVLIPTAKRVTACISSQAGCSLDCHFCATGLLDLKHNLHHYEIYDQIFVLNQEAIAHYDLPLSNIVYMGMGEPLLNYRNVMRSVDFVTGEDGLGMSPRRITVSTSGIAKMMKKLGDDGAKFEFALSLHSAIDEVRSRIMPINDSNNLESLADALRYFYDKTGTRVTLEYCVFQDVNDSPEAAKALADFSRIIPSKINIIEYNPFPESGFVNANPARMGRFIQMLESQRVIVNVRRSRGRDIDGGCGQLALRHTVA